MNNTKRSHWEHVYDTKESHEMGWYQKVPQTSLDFIRELRLSKDAAIIDIGGGDSYLAPTLLELGYTDITVLDLSANAIERAKKRLGKKAGLINWIVSDITEFEPTRKYDCWHDRAAFHFLIDETDIEKYVSIASEAINSNGNLIVGTFSLDGPKKCSGLPIRQYAKESLNSVFKENFKLQNTCSSIHITPTENTQKFTFCTFSKV